LVDFSFFNASHGGGGGFYHVEREKDFKARRWGREFSALSSRGSGFVNVGQQERGERRDLLTNRVGGGRFTFLGSLMEETTKLPFL